MINGGLCSPLYSHHAFFGESRSQVTSFWRDDTGFWTLLQLLVKPGFAMRILEPCDNQSTNCQSAHSSFRFLHFPSNGISEILEWIETTTAGRSLQDASNSSDSSGSLSQLQGDYSKDIRKHPISPFFVNWAVHRFHTHRIHVCYIW